MPRNRALLILLAVVVVTASAYAGFITFQYTGLPFNVQVIDAQTAVIQPIRGIPLPPDFRVGDRIDLSTLGTRARIAIDIDVVGRDLPLGQSYALVIRRGAERITLPVATVDLNAAADVGWVNWSQLCLDILLCGIALLLLWRGRNRSAGGMALWAIAFLVSVGCNLAPVDGVLGLCIQLLSVVFFLLARVGFYIMAESMVGAALTPRTRALFRVAFILFFAAGATLNLGGQGLFAATGWAEWLLPKYSFPYSWIYLVPTLMLFASYGSADPAQRLRLRWMLPSAVALIVAVSITNAIPLGFVTAAIVSRISVALAVLGFLYAVLRHRVVDISVVIDRTLVYGATTMFVVGVLAAVNSLALRATLGEGAGLLVQVIVPLALGIVLGKLRTYMNRIVERVFFRRKYLAEKALKSFARHCGHIEDVQHLLDAAVAEIRKQTGSPAVALYELGKKGYTCVRQTGDLTYPQHLDNDDPAVVAARAEHKSVDLSDLTSGLGTDGCVFPLTVLGVQRGVLVCANRPGEHYASDEKKLIAQVVRDIGAAWRILRARDNEEFVRAVARGTLKSAAAQKRAQALEAAWVGT